MFHDLIQTLSIQNILISNLKDFIHRVATIHKELGISVLELVDF